MKNQFYTLFSMLFLSLFFCLTAVATPPVRDVADQLDAADRLIVLGCESMFSPSYEKEDIERIMALAEEYDITPMRQLAELRKARQVDKGNSLANAASEELVKRVVKRHSGNISYAEAYVRLVRALSTPFNAHNAEYIVAAKEVATKLYESDKSIVNEEVYLVSRLLYIANTPDSFGPTLYEDFKRDLLRLFALYDANDLHSLLRQEFSLSTTRYLTYISMKGYEEYAAFIDKKLKDDPTVVYREVTENSLMQIREDEVRLRKPEGHPDILIVEEARCYDNLRAATRHAEIDRELQRMDSICQRSFDYFGPDSYFFNSMSLSRDIYAVGSRNTAAEWTPEHQHKVDVIKKAAGDNHQMVLGTLCSIFGAYVNGNPEFAAELFPQIEHYAELIKDFAPTDAFSALSNKIYLQRMGVPGYSDALEDLKHTLSEYEREGINWRYLYMAQSLASLVYYQFGQSQLYLDLYKKVYDTKCALIPEDNVLRVFCDETWLAATSSTLQAFDDPEYENLILKCIHDAESHGVNTANILLAQAIFYNNNDEREKAKEILTKAISLCEDDEELITANTTWLQLFSADYPDDAVTHSAMTYINELFEAESDDMCTAYMVNYYTLASCYAQRGDPDACHRVLRRCFDYYHDESLVPDNMYVMFVTGLLQIYANGYGNLEQCRVLLEEFKQNIESVKAYVDLNSYLMMLRTCYDLAESKSSNDGILLLSYLTPLSKAYGEYFALHEYSEDILWMHLPYLFLKLSNLWRIVYGDKRYLAYESMRQMREMNIEQMRMYVEVAQEMCEEVESTKRYMLNSDAYWNLLISLGQMFEYLYDDQEQAHFYYEKQKDLRKPGSQLWYMGYLIRHNRWAEALPIAEELAPSVDAEVDRLAKMGHIGSINEQISMLFNVFFHNDRTDEALRYAKMYHEMRNDMIVSNFDYFTPSERENFINKGGAGGWSIFSLLDKMEGQIQAEAYDVALQEKGLLLRNVERVRNAILNSGNEQLVQAMEEIRTLQQSMRSIPSDGTDEHIRQALALRTQIENLERYVTTQTAQYHDEAEAVPSWTEVRDALRKDEAAVEFVMGHEAIHALILTPRCTLPQKVRVFNNDNATELAAYFNDPARVTENMKRLYDNDAKRLYHIIWEPLLPYLKNAKTIYYSPTGMLNSICFNAFQLDDGSYLIDHYNLKQLSTTANIPRRGKQTAKGKKKESAIVIGGLCYDDTQQYGVKAEVERAMKTNNPVVAQREALESFQFLPYSYIEKDNIVATFSKMNVPVTQKYLMEASETDVRQLLTEKPTILHISTHGFSYPNQLQAMKIPYIANGGQPTPLNTAGIALSDANPAWEGDPLSREADNILTADELSAFDLRTTRLAVLSACNTALGATSIEGVMGLQRGLKMAGVETLCLSLWSVNDASSSSLMSNFYSNWLSGKKSMSEAMREAMLQQRTITPSPYYWAPFVLIDDIE